MTPSPQAQVVTAQAAGMMITLLAQAELLEAAMARRGPPDMARLVEMTMKAVAMEPATGRLAVMS